MPDAKNEKGGTSAALSNSAFYGGQQWSCQSEVRQNDIIQSRRWAVERPPEGRKASLRLQSHSNKDDEHLCLERYTPAFAGKPLAGIENGIHKLEGLIFPNPSWGNDNSAKAISRRHVLLSPLGER